jgi:glycosidase
MKLNIILLHSLIFTFSTLFAQDASLDWAKGAVWYQIFPERFRNANPDNDPVKERVFDDEASDWQVHPWTSDWYKLQPWEAARNLDFYSVVFDRRYGGDLIGVIEKLPYLKELGVDVIYFNPIFEAPSLHKYDTTTYHHVDNNFGYDRDGDWQAIQSEKEDPSTWTFTKADQVFLELISKAHELGIRIVIDGVFNHSGRSFWAFQDVIEKQQDSDYKDWFEIIRWDDPSTPDTNEFDYKSWWGFKSLPEFKEDQDGLVEPVKNYIFAITRRWMDPNGDGDPSDGIDGWRLDVAQDVKPKFWEEWNELVKSINPNAITIGEIWNEAPEWITKKRFDAVMNYPLAYVMVDFFVDNKTKISVAEFDQRLKRLRNIYPEDTNHILMNLIDSHDTDRIASMIKNPDRNYNQKAGVRDNPKYDPRKPNEEERRVQKLLAIFQLTYMGAPMIYYGDEAGMWGGKDPDDRKPMLWKEFIYENESYRTVLPDLEDQDENVFDPGLYNHYKKLIKIRHENQAIQRGVVNTRMIDNENSIYAYSRKYQEDEIIIILNNGTDKQGIAFATLWENGTKVKDLLNDNSHEVKDGLIKLSIDKKWAAVLAKGK